MSRLRLVCCLALLGGAAACQTAPPDKPAAGARAVVVEEAEAWRNVASERDAAALDSLPRPLAQGARRRARGEPVAPDRGGRRAPHSGGPARLGRAGAGKLSVPLRPAGRPQMGQLGAGLLLCRSRSGPAQPGDGASRPPGRRLSVAGEGGREARLPRRGGAGRRQDRRRLWREPGQGYGRPGRADRRVPLSSHDAGAFAGRRADRGRVGGGAAGLAKKKAARRRPFEEGLWLSNCRACRRRSR